jgi:hypothetical protein
LSRRFRRKIELDHIVGTGKKVNIKKRVQRFRGSKAEQRTAEPLFFRVSFSINWPLRRPAAVLNPELRTLNPNSDHQVFSI